MNFVRIAKTHEFEQRRFKAVTLLARRVAIFKEPDGSYYAIEASCKHQNADLTLGRLDGDIITCYRHGWQYCIKTGQCLTHDSAILRRYALKVEGEDIYVSLTPIEE